jgi:hypothetical protein
LAVDTGGAVWGGAEVRRCDATAGSVFAPATSGDGVPVHAFAA